MRVFDTVKVIFFCVGILISAMFCFRTTFGADISVLNGNLNLTISSAVAGQEPSSTTNETGQLQWTTLELDPTKKITAQTNLAGPSFTLKVQAINVSPGDGTAAGEVTLTTSANNFVVDIPAGISVGDPGICTLRYTASATASDGTGTDVHTVTYTITDQ